MNRAIRYFTKVLVLIPFLLALQGVISSVRGAGDGNLLKRSPEETCHSCHKTDKNSDDDPDAIKSHNSRNTGSTKWSSEDGWGVPDGKYGEFVCTTCHTPHDTSNIYLIRETINTSDGSLWETSGAAEVTVVFKKKATSANPNPGSPDGVMGSDAVNSANVCQVCHSLTSHFRWNGTGSDQTHDNVGGASGEDCTRCHSHKNGFAHGGGSGGTGCIPCHGHDAGTYYDPDMSLPYTAGTTQSQGRGSSQSHSTHTESISGISPGSAGDDDRKGPGIYCADCHDTARIPLFKDGETLANTTVCDPCHSPDGAYDGVNDSIAGAKANWKSGVYLSTNNSTLKAGKEKWCAGCHDDVPGNSRPDGSGINAPNVIGNESAPFTYGSGYGFYKTGHGLDSSETYPASGGITAGAGRGCSDCHDPSTSHIDGNARTYDDHNSSSTSPSEYRQGYRLKMIDGQEPMVIPKTGRAEASNSRLCFSCHTDSTPYTTSALGGTNFQDGTNRHFYHLDMLGIPRFSADWGGDCSASDDPDCTSRITCITCHNVHGSTNLAMVRDGKLINKEPGIKIWYYNSGISTNTNPPFPADLPLSASTGMIWIPSSAGNVCFACHGGPTQEIFGPRTPFQPTAQAPELDWTGENGYVSDGAAPDSAASGSTFTFRVKYTDNNNDAPSVIQLWIDADNNGSYESTYAMSGINEADNMYINGKIYTKTLTLTNAGSNIIRYRFYAKDTTDRLATGPATGDSSVTLTLPSINHPPVLAWVSGSCRFEGVSPAAQVSGSVFDFRVQYTDADNNAPTSIQVWVDTNDNDTYEDSEKYTMSVVGGDGDYSNGEIFTTSQTLNYAGDGKIKYRFVASDGTNTATGIPASDHKVTVVNNAPQPKTVCASGCDHTTIQAAVDVINGAHTVLVYAGTYNERVYFNGSNDNDTIVRSVCGPDDTVISSSGVTPAYGVEVTGSTGSVVDGFGITGGTIGVYLHHSSASTNITIENCKVHDNAGSGGIYCGDTSSITVNNSEVYSNTTTLTGAGIYLMEGTSYINDTVIRNNTASANGGGVGTGLWNNTTFTNTVIKDNIADGSGGGFAQTSDSSTAAFYRSTIIGNTASAGSGGGLYIQGQGGSYGLSIQNTVVADNQAPTGGGIYLDGNLSAVNCTIANNEATGSNGGGALYADVGCNVIIRNSILWNNYASIGSRHIAYLSSTAPTTISDSILNNDGGADFNRYPYIVVQSGGSLPTIEGFVSGADPFFVDAANGDYHIQSTSPAIDNANTSYAPAEDIDGDSRPQGLADDIGADEYRSSTSGSAPVLAWTGEPNYTADGVNPNSGMNGSSFTFRVHYADAGSGVPSVMQLWLDRNDNGAYDAGEKYEISPAGGGIYTTTIASLTAAGDGNLNYRFYATDGTNAAVGDPTNNSVVTVTAPTVTFTSASQATLNESGTAIITVQLSEAGSLDVTVPFTVSGSSTATAGGTDYSITASPVTITAGNTTANITVTITADSLDEDNETVIVNMGTPINAIQGATTTHTLTITDDDSEPTVTFTTASQATAGESGTATITAQLSVISGRNVTIPFTVNGSSTASGGGTDYSITASPVMIPADSMTADITVTITEDSLVEGNETVILDMGTPANATQGAITTHTLTITDDDTSGGNIAPILSWTTGNCLTEGVRPRTGAVNADFEFRVVYSDADNQCPSSIQVTVSGTPYDLTSNDGASCQTGRTYYRSISPGNAGDLNYSFSASDGIDIATGTPTADHAVSVINTTYKVRPTGGSGWYSTIQLAVDATSSAATVLVYPNSDFTSATYGAITLYSSKPSRTIQSVCGADLTTISGNGTATQAVLFSGASGDALDGFMVTGGTSYGVYTQTAPSTIKNCKIYGNQTGIYVNGSTPVTIDNNKVYSNTNRGINSTNSIVNISNNEISGNGTDANIQDGAGLYVNGGAGTHTITDTVIKDNKTKRWGGSFGRGGGILVQNGANAAFSRVYVTGNSSADYQGGGVFLMTAGTVTFDNAVIAGNQAGTSGGGVYLQGSSSHLFRNVTFADNQATTSGGAIYLNTQSTTVRNSIFWNNTATSGRNMQRNASASCGSLTYSDVTTGAGWTDNCSFTDITGNINPAQDPLFEGSNPYHIQSVSPCKDAITPANYTGPADDIDGSSRPYPVGGNYDMGADEYVP